MAKSAPLVLLMVFLALTATFSPLSHDSTTSAAQSEAQAALASPPDPSVRNIAFNVTLAQFDLYTNKTAIQPSPVSPSNITWFNSIIDGRNVNGTKFLFEIPADTTDVKSLNWTLTVARGNYTGSSSSHTFLRFRWNGNLTSGTNVRYLLFDDTSLVHEVVHSANFTSGQSPRSLPCFADEECVDLSSFIGKSLNLVFKFNSTLTGKGLKVQVSHVAVASVSPQFVNPSTDIHMMNVDVDPSSRIIHTANSTVAVYNTTTTQPVHVWNSTAVIFRFPTAYTLTNITMAGTTVLNLTRTLDTGTCPASCTNRLPIGNTTVSGTQFISFNLTAVYAHATTASVAAVITALSSNAVGDLKTALGSVTTNFWVPGDLLGVRVRIEPSLNVSGAQNITLIPPTGPIPPGLDQPVNSKGGTYLYNLTLPTTAALGLWTVRGTFLNSYDLGFRTHDFRVEQINTGTLTVSGEAGQGKALTVGGTLTYGNSSAAGGVNATVFAVDTGSPPGPVSLSGGPLQPGLYISNITLTNGAFSENQPLIVLFTIVNPALSTAFTANLTIQHEWYFGSGGSHETEVTFPLTLGDEPFNLSPTSTYRMDASLTSSGVQVSVKSLTRTSVPVVRMLTPGPSPVSPSRQHFGLFNIVVTSRPFAGGSPNTNSLRSPTYAYVMMSGSVTPSRLLESSSTVTSLPNGTFSATVKADKLLGAKRLVLFVLARHANGVVTGIGQVKTVSESTILTPTANIPADVTIRQSITVILNLKSNSTTLPITLTVNVDVSGSTAFGTKTVTIQPKNAVPIDFPITAPDAAGSYLLTFSSPQYGVILTKELKVGLLQSSLQVLIPAIIGLVAALVILGLYLMRKPGGMEIEEAEKKRPAPGKPSKPTQGSSGQKSLTRS